MTHIIEVRVPQYIHGIFFDWKGNRFEREIPYGAVYEKRIKWDLKEDFQKLKNLASLILSTIHNKKVK